MDRAVRYFRLFAECFVGTLLIVSFFATVIGVIYILVSLMRRLGPVIPIGAVVFVALSYLGQGLGKDILKGCWRRWDDRRAQRKDGVPWK